MMPNTTRWLGKEESFRNLDLQMRRVMETPDPAIIKMYSRDDDDDEMNPIEVQLVGNLALLKVSGPLLNRSNWITRYLGIATYEDIRNQMMNLAEDDDIAGLMFNINSPGGSADGCFALGRFVRAYNDNVKGVVGFTDGEACSAAYALMTATSNMLMSEDAIVGSIGVLAVHTELTEMYKEIGIKHEVFRSTPHKALGQPVEKLTEQARAAIQKDVMHLHNNFVRYLSGMLDMDAESINKNIASGKTFTAPEAMKHKLVNNVMTFEEAVGKLATALEKPKPKGFLPQSKS